MYDSEKATMEALRVQLDRQLAVKAPEARTTAVEYMSALAAFVDAFNGGPGADPQRMGHDTTGALARIEADVIRAEAERHRVRTAPGTLA